MKTYTVPEGLLLNATQAVGSLLVLLQQASENEEDQEVMNGYLMAFENVHKELLGILEEG